ncbi:MAG: hypothetical protein ACYSWX_08620 [Planctomycetota bacterium]|jgi:hypothetical protein
MQLTHTLRTLARRILERLGLGIGPLKIEPTTPGDLDPDDPECRFSRAWYERLYEELGDGITCYRPAGEANYGGGALEVCGCCQPNLELHLLPGEEVALSDTFNATDFQLREHPTLEGRKSILCNKLGQCGGRKPFVCRTHPVHFADGLVLFEEGLCRLRSTSFMARHADFVDKVRATVLEHGLDKVPLGYGRVIQRDGERVYADFER